jgi:glycine cleavage system H protein
MESTYSVSSFEGLVSAVNALLAANPELINQSAYGKGYFFSMELTNETEKSGLMDAAAYRKYVEGLTK